jgi:hypothetical protein
MFSTLRLPADDGDGVFPTDLAVSCRPPEELPTVVPWPALAVLLTIANSSAELITASESTSLGIAGLLEELALPKVAVLFEDITATGRYGNVQVMVFSRIFNQQGNQPQIRLITYERYQICQIWVSNNLCPD